MLMRKFYEAMSAQGLNKKVRYGSQFNPLAEFLKAVLLC